jgi:nucleoside-diphosphate-sugar epimerase
MPKKFAFVNYGNSREGKAIADALKEEQYFVYSTRRLDPQALDDLVPDPLSVDQFVAGDAASVLAAVQACHVVIYTILDTPRYAVELLTRLNDAPGVRKSVVVVSPAFTWAGEPRAEDWHKRWPHPRYADHLGAERYLTASLQLRLSVLCVGLLYGDGEGALLPLFRAAWRLRPAPMLRDNRNVVPTLHVRDMARGAVQLALARPAAPVILAHDGSRTRQRDLVRAVNRAFGAGRTPRADEPDAVRALGREAVDWLKLDIENEPEDFAALEFERHCASPTEEIQALVDEFVKCRLIAPLRVLSVDLPSALVRQVVEYYGLVHATMPAMREALALDKSEDAVALKESAAGDGEEEQKLPDAEVMKFVLGSAAAYKNQGFIMSHRLVPKDEEEREALFVEDEEPATYMPKYVLTWHEFRATEKWFIAKGAHCATVKTLADVQKFLGLPRNFAREVRILETRRQLEQSETEKADAERKRIKKEKQAEEARKQALIERDEGLLKEVEAEIASMREVREMTAREYLMKYIVPMFGTPLRQINEARPSDPLRFLAAYFEKQALNP